jgi:YD repeat-containing protein
VVTAHEDYGEKDRDYTYDSLGNLTQETNSNNVTVDYRLNSLNQITESTDDGWNTSTAYTYDNRAIWFRRSTPKTASRR